MVMHPRRAPERPDLPSIAWFVLTGAPGLRYRFGSADLCLRAGRAQADQGHDRGQANPGGDYWRPWMAVLSRTGYGTRDGGVSPAPFRRARMRAGRRIPRREPGYPSSRVSLTGRLIAIHGPFTATPSAARTLM